MQAIVAPRIPDFDIRARIDQNPSDRGMTFGHSKNQRRHTRRILDINLRVIINQNVLELKVPIPSGMMHGSPTLFILAINIGPNPPPFTNHQIQTLLDLIPLRIQQKLFIQLSFLHKEFLKVIPPFILIPAYANPSPDLSSHPIRYTPTPRTLAQFLGFRITANICDPRNIIWSVIGISLSMSL